MRVALAQLAPVPGDRAANAARLADLVASVPADLLVAPELYLTGYALGDRFHGLAAARSELAASPVAAAARSAGTDVVVGTAVRGAERPGELENAAVRFGADGRIDVQAKRYLPTYGPFEEGARFTPAARSEAFPFRGGRLGLAVCYDAFFPEVARELALGGATLLVYLSASPVTSGALFAKVLPARAVENAVPVVFVNRVGVEDGLVFAGGSGAWDVRGEPVPATEVPFGAAAPDERVTVVELDPEAPARWRPFRPVLRDRAGRPAGPAPPGLATPTDRL